MSVAEQPRANVQSAARGEWTGPDVRRRLELLRRRTVRFRLLLDIGRAVLLATALLAALTWADYRLELAWGWRAVGMLAAIAAVAWSCLRAARGRYGYSTRDAAADVEAHFPQYGQRIRTSRDYGDPDAHTAPAEPGIVSLLQADTQQYAQDIDFQRVAKPRPVLMTWLAVAIALLVGLALLLADAEKWTSLGRALLLPLQYTQVTVTPHDGPVMAGHEAVISAEVVGRPVRQAELLYRPAGSEQPWSRLPLLPVADELPPEDDRTGVGGDEAPEEAARPTDEQTSAESSGVDQASTRPLVGRLQATLVDCREDLDYKVIAGPLDSQVWQLSVLQPLEMQQFTAHIESPSYTRRPPETTESMDLKVLEGATVQLEVTMNRAAAEARLVPLDDQGQPLPDQASQLQIVDNCLRGTLPAMRQSLTCLITAAAADGIQFESPRLRIQVQPDAKPKIRFVEPPEDLEVIPTTEVTMAIEAGDDFGLSRIEIAYQVNDGPLETLWSQQFDTDEPRELQVRPVLALENYQLTHQDSVTYHAFVEDNHPDGPRRTTTELRFIDIRPFKQEYEILPASGGT